MGASDNRTITDPKKGIPVCVDLQQMVSDGKAGIKGKINTL